MQMKAVVFDLDGTLIHTLPDLVAITNTTMEHFGFPCHSEEAIRDFIGNGVRALVDRAVPDDVSDDTREKALLYWRSLYSEMGHALSHPYDGVEEMLQELKKQGYKLGVLSNKFNAATQEVVPRFFPGVFDAIHGEGDGYPRKPQPEGLLQMLSDINVDPKNACYVGDAPTDMEAALAAGCKPYGVSWGYNSVECLTQAHAHTIIHQPRELLRLLSEE